MDCIIVYRLYIYTMLCYAKSLQSCPTLRDPIDGSPPGSTVPRILQVRTLEWVAISFSNAGKWKWSRSVILFVLLFCPYFVLLFATPWAVAYQDPPPWDFPGKSTGVVCHCLLRYTALTYSFSYLEAVCCSISSSNCGFLTCTDTKIIKMYDLRWELS